MEYRESEGAKDEGFRGLGLTSRKNLCLHPEVSVEERNGGKRRLMRGELSPGQQREEGKGRRC